MRYDYSAINLQGHRVSGRLEASHAAELEVRLRHMGLDLIRMKPVRPSILPRLNRVRRRELIHFWFQLQQLLRAGIPLQESLTDLRDSLEHAALRSAAASLLDSIEGGQTLSQAMTAQPELFNPVVVSLVRAGEASGDLDAVLEQLLSALKWEDELKAQTQKLLLYPAFVTLVVLAATTFLLTYLVPQLKLFITTMGQTLPLYTQALFLASDLMLAYGYLPMLALLPSLLILFYLLAHHPPSQRGFDRLKLRLPLLGNILRKIILARLASTLAMLYAAGIPVLDALRMCRDVAGNSLIHQALEQTEQSIRDGQNMASAFQGTGLFPPLVVRMVGIGERTGALDQALHKVSYFYNRDVQESVSQAQALIEPVLTLILGLLLGWIMLAVLGPLYDSISQVQF